MAYQKVQVLVGQMEIKKVYLMATKMVVKTEYKQVDWKDLWSGERKARYLVVPRADWMVVGRVDYLGQVL